MAGLNCSTCAGVVVAAGIDMHGPGWCVDSAGLLTLLRYDMRGDDQIVPPDEGVEPDGWIIHATEHSLPITIAGEYTQAGVLNVDPWAGLVENLQYLFDNLVEPPGTEAGTRPWTFTPAGQAARSAAVRVLDLRYPPKPFVDESHGPVHVGTLEIFIPAGRFV